MTPVNFLHALDRLPFDEKLDVEITASSEKNSGVNLIGTLIRNPHGFAFVEVSPDLAANTKRVEAVTKKPSKGSAKKGR